MAQLTSGANVQSESQIAAGIITNASISTSAAIAFSKLAALTSGNILVGSAGNVATSVTMSGDITISNAGVTTIGANKVVSTMIANNTITTNQISASAGILNTQLELGYKWVLVQKQNAAGSNFSFTGLTGQNEYLLYFAATSGAANINLRLYFNSDQTAKYWYSQPNGTFTNAATSIVLFQNSTANPVDMFGEIRISCLSSTYTNTSVLVTAQLSRGNTTSGIGTAVDQAGYAPAAQTAITTINLQEEGGTFTGPLWLFKRVDT